MMDEEKIKEYIEKLKKFIKNERDAIEDYTSMALDADSAIISNMFHTTATQEMEHLQMFEELVKNLEEGECRIR